MKPSRILTLAWMVFFQLGCLEAVDSSTIALEEWVVTGSSLQEFEQVNFSVSLGVAGDNTLFIELDEADRLELQEDGSERVYQLTSNTSTVPTRYETSFSAIAQDTPFDLVLIRETDSFVLAEAVFPQTIQFNSPRFGETLDGTIGFEATWDAYNDTTTTFFKAIGECIETTSFEIDASQGRLNIRTEDLGFVDDGTGTGCEINMSLLRQEEFLPTAEIDSGSIIVSSESNTQVFLEPGG